jgi:uncharacterized membrane protein YkvI
MRGAIPSLPQYAFMAWCSAKNTRMTRRHSYMPPFIVTVVIYLTWVSLYTHTRGSQDRQIPVVTVKEELNKKTCLILIA